MLADPIWIRSPSLRLRRSIRCASTQVPFVEPRSRMETVPSGRQDQPRVLAGDAIVVQHDVALRRPADEHLTGHDLEHATHGLSRKHHQVWILRVQYGLLGEELVEWPDVRPVVVFVRHDRVSIPN